MKGGKAVAIISVVCVFMFIIGVIFVAVGYGIGGMEALRFYGKEAYEHEEKVFTERIKNIDIDVDAGTVKIVRGQEFKLIGENFFKDCLKYEVSGETLKVKETSPGKWIFNFSFINGYDPEVILYVPEEYVFEKVNISVGAGAVEMEEARSEFISIECGAGLADCKNLVSENIELTNGVGKIQISVKGDVSDYYVSAENGIGSISINGEKYNKEDFDKNAPNKLTAENGVGEISINFE